LVGVGIQWEDIGKVDFESVDTAEFVGGSVGPGILEVGEVDDGKGEGIGVAVHLTGISESGFLSEDLFGAPCATENVEIVDLDFAVPLAIATADLAQLALEVALERDQVEGDLAGALEGEAGLLSIEASSK
jgi:hypothetical protein